MRRSDWVIVIPVKGTTAAKSRMDAMPGLALAIALDTVEAALAVAEVVVVTSASAAEHFEALGARVAIDAGGGLNAAALQGLAVAGAQNHAVLLGDLPALRSAELSGALKAAHAFPRALVPDAEGVGTVLITARSGAMHHPSFGEQSRAKHVEWGYVQLDVDPDSGLRRDADTRSHLQQLHARLGKRTRAALDGRAP
jgi:2-phospho-L-lactate guanylyltransferase